MKSKRQRIDPVVINRERGQILSYVVSNLEKGDGQVCMDALFEAYKKWLRRHKLQSSVLSVDSFGRLFPEGFERKIILVGARACRGIVGVRVKA